MNKREYLNFIEEKLIDMIEFDEKSEQHEYIFDDYNLIMVKPDDESDCRKFVEILNTKNGDSIYFRKGEEYGYPMIGTKVNGNIHYTDIHENVSESVIIKIVEVVALMNELILEINDDDVATALAKIAENF